MAEVILTAMSESCASVLSLKSADSCTMWCWDFPQSAGTPKGLRIPFQLGEMAVEEEFADSARFCSFADGASASVVDSSTSPSHPAFGECDVSAGEADAALAAAVVAVFEFAAATVNRP